MANILFTNERATGLVSHLEEAKFLEAVINGLAGCKTRQTLHADEESNRGSNVLFSFFKGSAKNVTRFKGRIGIIDSALKECYVIVGYDDRDHTFPVLGQVYQMADPVDALFCLAKNRVQFSAWKVPVTLEQISGSKLDITYLGDKSKLATIARQVEAPETAETSEKPATKAKAKTTKVAAGKKFSKQAAVQPVASQETAPIGEIATVIGPKTAAKAGLGAN